MPERTSDSAQRRTTGPPVHGALGDSAAWIRDHLDAVYRYARRRLSREDAEDVTQQTFEALFKARAQGRMPRNAGAYLLGTARRRIADLYRARRRKPPPLGLPEGWEAFDECALPDAALESAEMRDLVHVALGLLSGADRAALLAYYRDGVAVAEIAARIDVTPKAAEMRLRRARAAFRDLFEAVGRDWLGETSAPAERDVRGAGEVSR